MSNSPIRALIGSHFARVHKPPGIVDTTEVHLEMYDGAAAIGAEAVAGCGVGLDHQAGERVLVAMLLRDCHKGHEHRLAAAITDSRTLLSGWSSTKGAFNSKRSSLAHAALTAVEHKQSMLSGNFVRLQAAELRCELSFRVDVNKMLGAFYQTMGQHVPPQARVPPPTDFVVPGEGDPSGARGALERLYVTDERAAAMLGQVESGVSEGRLDATAGLDMTGRIVLAHRSRAGGPGMFNQGWLSPMTTVDFGPALISIFGQPVTHEEAGRNRVLDFRLDPQRDYGGAAMKALGAASFVALGVGLSPAKMIAGALVKKAPITQLRLIYGEHAAMTRFTMLTGGAPLEQRDSKLAHRLHQALIHTGYAVLERRCALGWGVDYATLFA